MNILAVDFGTKNIGLAWCDTAVNVVLPYGVTDKEKLPALIKEEKIEKVVIGLPLGLDGKEYASTARVKKFAEELKSKITVPIDFFDERFSSHAADRMAGGASRDEKAAMMILEGYLCKQ